jgi:hypothetical protein
VVAVLAALARGDQLQGRVERNTGRGLSPCPVFTEHSGDPGGGRSAIRRGAPAAGGAGGVGMGGWGDACSWRPQAAVPYLAGASTGAGSWCGLGAASVVMGYASQRWRRLGLADRTIGENAAAYTGL